MITKLLLKCFLFFTICISAQTTLSPGGIMFIGLNSDSTGSPAADEFAVIFLEPVTAGTEIYFTDFGYTGNTAPYFQQNPNNGCGPSTGGVSDGMVKWTAPSGGVSVNSQLVIRVNMAGTTPTANIGSVIIIAESSTTGDGMSLTSAGEAVHAFQGAINGSNQVTSATMLASIHYNNTTWETNVTTCQFSSTISENPNTGYEVVYGAEWDNGYYSGDLTGSISDIQASIQNMGNWTQSNTTTYVLPITTLGINDININEEFKMYPNPASEMVYFNKNIKKISVYNSLGKRILVTSKNNFNVQPYISGLYIIKIETENGISTKKLMKI